ncbi:MAG: hypothetical protein R3231_05775, partial [bacterium]|nr:hypothetical protein [bacterium]
MAKKTRSIPTGSDPHGRSPDLGQCGAPPKALSPLKQKGKSIFCCKTAPEGVSQLSRNGPDLDAMVESNQKTAFFRVNCSLSIFPVIHESAEYALEVRQRVLGKNYDCLAVALPRSFEEPVMAGVARLPFISAVMQREEGTEGAVNYVPIDPCQGLVMGIRLAMEEYIPCKFIDMEVNAYEVYDGVFPDSHALKRIPGEKFLAALLPVIGKPEPGSQQEH